MSLQQLLSPSLLVSVRPALFLAVVELIGAVALPSTRAWGAEPSTSLSAPASTLTLIDRSIVQDQGSWQVDYRLRYDGVSGLIVTPSEVAGKVDGWVSNSRVASHALPRGSSMVISGATGPSATAEVIASADEAQRCRERVVLQAWTGDTEPPPEPVAKAGTGHPPANANANANGNGNGGAERAPILSIAPGATVRVRLRLDHQHFLYGDYDPLLGVRAVELHLGAATFSDPVVPMDREQYLAQPRGTWPVPPEDRRDTRHFVSGPDSLHLEAHVPGNQYYRFPERPVRYGTKMRLRFWYLVAAGTEGECRARVAQYKDTPTAWKVLTDGAHEEMLTTVGRWVKVERIFRTEAEATTLALDFRIAGNAEIGEVWIDDVSLEPVGAASPEP